MANSQKRGNGNFQRDVTFVDLQVTADMEKNMKSSHYADSQWYNVLNRLVKDGFKVTVKDDPRGRAVMAMVQAADYDDPANNIIWVIRSGTAAGALLKLCFYYEATGGMLPSPHERLGDYSSDDDLFA